MTEEEVERMFANSEKLMEKICGHTVSGQA